MKDFALIIRTSREFLLVMTLVLTHVLSSNAGLHTVTIDVESTEDYIVDSGFENIMGSEPDSGSLPWFSTDEGSDLNFKPSTNVVRTGNQAVVFASYGGTGAIVQNLDVQVDADKNYHASLWMLTSDPSLDPSHTNTPAIQVTLFTSPTLGGTYAYRKGFVWDKTPSSDDLWEEVAGTIKGSDVAAYDGEYIQIRIAKSVGNVTHRIYIDDVMLKSASPVAPHKVDHMAMGTGLIYSWAADSTYANGQIDHILKDIGIGSLRWPGGAVVALYHWDDLNGNGWKDSWDPSYDPADDQPPENYMDLDEYLAMIDRTGAEIMLGVNMSSGKEWNREAEGIAEAQALMQYCYDQG